MIILVDMDDVMEQLAKGWVDYLNEKYCLNKSIDDVNDWDISKAFPELTYDEVYAAELDDAIWDYVEPMPGAAEGIRKLIDDGHDVFVVTATIYQTLRSKMEKVLFRYFPYLDWDSVIVTSNKYLIKGDVLIDDGPHNFVKGDYRKILFNANHNRSFDENSVGAKRVYNWDEAYDEICKIAEEIESK